MPPLLQEETEALNTQFSGLLCENIVKTYFISKQINIATPDVDNGVDFLILKPEQIVRAQVKKVVYTLKRDKAMFCFNYQSSAAKNRKQKLSGKVDCFYHVLATPYRQLIFETPETMIPLRENGEYIHGRCAVLDRDSFIRKKSACNYNQLLIHSQYHPLVYQSFPTFFI